MVTIILTIIATILLGIGLYLILEKEDLLGSIPLFIGIIIICTTSLSKRTYKVYYKSSDMPYWELSNKHFKSDTTTIDTLYFNNKEDTVYRTINYIVVE